MSFMKPDPVPQGVALLLSQEVEGQLSTYRAWVVYTPRTSSRVSELGEEVTAWSRKPTTSSERRCCAVLESYIIT